MQGAVWERIRGTQSTRTTTQLQRHYCNPRKRDPRKVSTGDSSRKPSIVALSVKIPRIPVTTSLRSLAPIVWRM